MTINTTTTTITKNDFAQLAAKNGYTSHYSGRKNTMFVKEYSYLTGKFTPNKNFVNEVKSNCNFKIKLNK